MVTSCPQMGLFCKAMISKLMSHLLLVSLTKSKKARTMIQCCSPALMSWKDLAKLWWQPSGSIHKLASFSLFWELSKMKLVMKKGNGKKEVISTTASVLGSCTVLSKIRIKVQFGDTSCTDFKRGIAFEVVRIIILVQQYQLIHTQTFCIFPCLEHSACAVHSVTTIVKMILQFKYLHINSICTSH